MLDILHHKNNKLWAIEVKSSTSVKDYHYTDAAFQYYVMTQSGCVPDHFFLMHINNQYVKKGEITAELFHLENITEEIIKMQPWVAENFQNLLQILHRGEEPLVEIGSHCSTPFSCDYSHHCWKHVPENSVFELVNGRNKPWDLYHQGILKIEDIPHDYHLTFSQQLQVNGIRNNESYEDFNSITEFLNTWENPLHFFDFETLFAAIPVLDGTRPYQQVPFQYSLHIIDAQNNTAHKEFLADPRDFLNPTIDPRKKMIDQMKLDFHSTGSIVTYNKSFEKSRLQELALFFPEDAPFLFGLLERLVDLYDIFRSAGFTGLKWEIPLPLNPSFPPLHQNFLIAI